MRVGRIVVVRPRPARPSFSQRLEAEALHAMRRAGGQLPASPALWTTVSEMALTLEQLHAVRRMHAHVREDVRRLESYVQRDIRRWMPPRLDYLDRYRQVRERLRLRQLKLKAEGRRLALAEAESVRPLQDRLLTLLSRQRYLGVLHDDREAGA